MPTRLIFHIGRSKTGTTALQRYLRAAKASLADQGILYPEAGRLWIQDHLDKAQHQIALQCHPRHHREAEFERIKAEFAEEAAGWDTVLLSSEGFQNLTDLTLLERFFDGLDGYEVTTVCYLREYLDYLVSSYRQMIQNQPQFRTFSDYCVRSVRVGAFIDRWKSIGETVFRPYDRGLFPGGDIVNDFLACIGAERDPEIADRISNPSIGGNLLFFRLVENRFDLERTDNRAAEILALDHAPFRKAFHLSEEEAAGLRARSDYNRIVEAEVGALPIRSFADEPVVPVTEAIEEDLRRVYAGARLDEMTNAIAGLADRGRNWLAVDPLEFAGEKTTQQDG